MGKGLLFWKVIYKNLCERMYQVLCCVCILFFACTTASALSCANPNVMRESAPVVYMMRVVLIDEKPVQHSKDSYEWRGKMEVLKIYRGDDVSAISTQTDLVLTSSCHEVWGPPCADVSRPVAQVGQLWIIYDSAHCSEAYIGSGLCAGTNQPVEDAKLQVFEQTNPPVWVRE